MNLQKLLVIQKVMEQKVKITIGRGKNATTKLIYKYKSKLDEQIRRETKVEIQRLSNDDDSKRD